ncbi:MAG: tetratricopeptide repeat protein [Bacteroidales bacterium]
MVNTENIIKYISSEMETEERKIFEQRLTSDSVLEGEYKSVLLIWNIAKEKLLIEELPDKSNRDELIASIIAEIDIERYRNTEPTQQEHVLLAQLNKVAEKYVSEKKSFTSKSYRLIYKTGLFIAAVSTLLVLILWPERELQDLAEAYYNPANSALLDQFAGTTRSQNLLAMEYFKEGEYGKARVLFENDSLPGKNNPAIKMFYAITCFETGEPSRAMELLKTLTHLENTTIPYHASWYLAIYHIMEDQPGKAVEYLNQLTDHEGIYRRKSAKLIRRLETP